MSQHVWEFLPTISVCFCCPFCYYYSSAQRCCTSRKEIAAGSKQQNHPSNLPLCRQITKKIENLSVAACTPSVSYYITIHHVSKWENKHRVDSKARGCLITDVKKNDICIHSSEKWIKVVTFPVVWNWFVVERRHLVSLQDLPDISLPLLFMVSIGWCLLKLNLGSWHCFLRTCHLDFI